MNRYRIAGRLVARGLLAVSLLLLLGAPGGHAQTAQKKRPVSEIPAVGQAQGQQQPRSTVATSDVLLGAVILVGGGLGPLALTENRPSPLGGD